MSEQIKIFTIAHVPPGLERAWIQHLRDFDTAHPGCHFEVISDVPNAPMQKMIDMMLIHPELPILQIYQKVDRGET